MYKKQRKVRILIPNATSPKNIGDLAMLVSLIDLINKSVENAYIIVHSSDPLLHDKKIANKIDDTLYSWAAFENRSVASRVYRLFLLISSYLQIKLSFLPLLNKRLNNLVNDYKTADIIIFVGGGYLRSRKGFTQSLNLIMQLLLFQYAKLFNSRKIVSPISFGPFAYKWQESLSAKILNGLEIIAAREEFSYQLMKNNKVPNLILSSDHALLLNTTFN